MAEPYSNASLVLCHSIDIIATFVQTVETGDASEGSASGKEVRLTNRHINTLKDKT